MSSTDLAAMDMRVLLGRTVRRIRLDNGPMQEQFSEDTSFTQQYISGLSRRQCTPIIVTRFALAPALGVNHLEPVKPTGDGKVAGK